MLKYQINANRQRNDLVPIDISDFTIEDIIDGVDDSENFTYSDKQLLMCYCDNELPFDENARIIAKSERYMDNDDLISATAYSFNTVYKPTSVNKENRSFTLTIDKYFDLSIEKTDIVTDENDKEWWYIYFNGSHLFDTQSNDVYTLYLTFDGINGYNVDDLYTFLIGASVDDITDTDNKKGKGEYVNSSTIRIEKEALDNIIGLFDVIFYGTIYRLRSNPTSVVSEEYYNSLRPEQQAEYYKDYEYKDVSRLKLYRDNFIFVPDGFTLYLDKPMAVLQIPFSQKFATDLMQDDAIKENFTDVEKKKAINRITEMEKDVYHPVIWKTSSNNNHGDIQGEVYKIRFNLHFRQHRGDDWLADAGSFWNGIKGEGGSLTFIKNYFSYIEHDKEPSSFTDDDKKRISNQSDLLTYLNFTDKDVRYQKNKLKKSFLRVMFYDSTNPTNQNMLAYYTIFVDSGEDFSKYVRYIETEGYKRIAKDPDYEVKQNLTGIKVDREPTKTSKLVTIENSTDVDDIESVRISSQFVVQDKYMSNASSEGFYLYLWKDNMNGVMPTDIYMKVEFNHAGYGRTIPFMCPFFDPNKGEGNGFKTFDRIRQDWDVSEENYGTTSDTRYGIRKYLKYSYIHFKYKYDKVDKRHIYYLDDEFYGDGVYFKDNAITLNLYEAKIA